MLTTYLLLKFLLIFSLNNVANSLLMFFLILKLLLLSKNSFDKLLSLIL